MNECAQLAQGYRYLQYWHNGGREAKIAAGGKVPETAKKVAAELVKKT